MIFGYQAQQCGGGPRRFTPIAALNFGAEGLNITLASAALQGPRESRSE